LAIVKVPQELSGLLSEPGLVRIGSNASQKDAARAEFDEEEYKQGMQSDSPHGKEIAGQELLFVMGEQVSPAGGAVADRGRFDVVASEDIADGSLRSFEAQLLEFAIDLAIAPTRILLG
jgi:hypothetical protein